MSRWITEQVGYPPVKGECPSCGTKSLFLGKGGYVTCAVIGCKAPSAASDVLKRGSQKMSRQQLEKEISGAIKSTIHAHGDIDLHSGAIGSASKRVASQVFAMIRSHVLTEVSRRAAEQPKGGDE